MTVDLKTTWRPGRRQAGSCRGRPGEYVDSVLGQLRVHECAEFGVDGASPPTPAVRCACPDLWHLAPGAYRVASETVAGEHGLWPGRDQDETLPRWEEIHSHLAVDVLAPSGQLQRGATHWRSLNKSHSKLLVQTGTPTKTKRTPTAPAISRPLTTLRLMRNSQSRAPARTGICHRDAETKVQEGLMNLQWHR